MGRNNRVDWSWEEITELTGHGKIIFIITPNTLENKWQKCRRKV
jgi:hypothetical protein